MTENHSFPITPPPELVQQWVAEIWHEGTPVQVALSDEHIATRAAQWGADQELEACCEVVSHWYGDWVNGINLPIMLRTARRPKPLSLKEQALRAISQLENGAIAVGERADTIRRALKSIPDPS
jgi:hypothetical protein